MRPRAAWLLAALTLAAVPAAAENAPRRVLVYLTALPGSGVKDGELAALYETLLARLAEDAPSVVAAEAPTVGTAPAAPGERSREAWGAGADGWLWVGVGGGAKALVLRVQSFDVAAGGDLRERTFEKPRADRIEDSFWDEVVAEAQSRFSVPAARRDERSTAVSVHAAPGTRISGLAGGEIVVGAGGEASVALPSYGTYTLTATHPQYRPFAKTFYLKDMPLLIECDQMRVGPWALELGLDRLAYPSFRLAWFAIPDRLLVEVGWTSYTVGIPLWGDEANTDRPLNLVGASAKVYLGRPDALLRPYAGAEAFVRLLNNGSGDWLGVELDGRSHAGFGVSAGVELGRHPVVKPFVQYNPRAYVLTDAEGIRWYYETLDLYRGDVPRYVYVGPLLADLFDFEAGVRIRL